MSSAPHPDDLATGLIRVHADGTINWLNRSAADLLARSPRNLIGTALSDHSPSLAHWLDHCSDSRRSLRVPEARIESDRPPVDACFHATPPDILIELHPVAERLRQRELAERADREQALSLLTRRLAHELRNPLAGVRGAAQLITAAHPDARSGEHARLIQREVDRITSLIERFAEGDAPCNGVIDLHRVLDEVIELVGVEHAPPPRFARNYDPSIPPIQGDSAQVHRLFLNLVRNAVQAGGRTIGLVTRIEHHCALLDEAGHAVRIDIEDDGEGVDPALRDRLFLPLVSGRRDGSGFGLAIVQQIVRAHGGLVEHQPLDPGSRFRVRLPLIPAKEEDHE
ncbi:hypothetical protein IC757_14840 [Wenzhouxiangella sp. AB-CW3]|uniref:two-component system sensor histidine kinase NtrB n=1 Tax=Wenzhouxiangella sp. AB-CW3 TaxID=2771012 RepID=UPI00168AAF86|nr:ATP-binding protein [Wenzhouxiangella sp. AB-CW3]QOC22277.1 hypothetical protein IC757_14840 [Wenzhouxiangella sp. AB-CW3]